MLAPLAASLVQPVTSSVVKGISGREVRRIRRGYMVKNLRLLILEFEITSYFNDGTRFYWFFFNKKFI